MLGKSLKKKEFGMDEKQNIQSKFLNFSKKTKNKNDINTFFLCSIQLFDIV